jgi:hypothetical protein
LNNNSSSQSNNTNASSNNTNSTSSNKGEIQQTSSSGKNANPFVDDNLARKTIMEKMNPREKENKSPSPSNAAPNKSTVTVYAPTKKPIHPKILWDMSDEEWKNFGDRFP